MANKYSFCSVCKVDCTTKLKKFFLEVLLLLFRKFLRNCLMGFGRLAGKLHFKIICPLHFSIFTLFLINFFFSTGNKRNNLSNNSNQLHITLVSLVITASVTNCHIRQIVIFKYICIHFTDYICISNSIRLYFWKNIKFANFTS